MDGSVATAPDPSIVALAKGIRDNESPTSTPGKSGEQGYYQFMPGHYQSLAKQYLGNANAPMTKNNQNYVVYQQIKAWKSQGYNPGQIASLWNSGSPDPSGKVGTNAAGAPYNTPDYVKNVYAAYQKYKGDPLTQTPPAPATTPPPTPTPQSPFGKSLGALPSPQEAKGFLKGEAKGLASTINSANPLDTMNKMAGKKTFSETMGVDINKVTTPQGADESKGFAAEQVASLAIPTDVAITGVQAGIASGAEARMVRALTPKLTPTELKTAGKAGQATAPSFFGKGGVSGEAMPEVKSAVNALQSVAQKLGVKATSIIKSGSAQVTKNLNRVGGLISQYAEKSVKPLLSQNPVPFNFEDLRGAFTNVKPSSSFKTGSEAWQTYSRIQEETLSSIANTLRKIGKTSNITDFNDIWAARKVIDNKITEELGKTAFDSPQYTGVKAAAADMRSAFAQFISDSFRYSGQMEKVNMMNRDIQAMRSRGMQITEDMLPAIKKSYGIVEDATKSALSDQWDSAMKDMHSLFNAEDFLASKLRTEQGKTAFELWRKSHPAIMGAAKLVGIGLGAALGTDVLKHIGL